MFGELIRIYYTSRRVLKNGGTRVFLERGLAYLRHRSLVFKDSLRGRQVSFKDVLFISGCSLPHPTRYRVDHQMEQLHFNGGACDKIWYQLLEPEMEQCYRCFVFFRCPITPEIERFVSEARRLNKRVFFDIDDLVINQKYTQTIKYLGSLSSDDLTLYNDGVERMQKLLRLCDGAITTTTRLATELLDYVPRVFINRNVASEKMLALSLAALKRKKQSSGCVVLGYFSGSITHNDDIRMIEPVLQRLLRENYHVRLLLAGVLSVPSQFAEFGDRIIVESFQDWTDLPELIAKADVNLVPLETSIFNEAKSENKWLEAALVKVPTVASKLGPFQEILEDGKTVFLCETLDEWYAVLTRLVSSPELLASVAENAHRKALEAHTTAVTGHKLAAYLGTVLAPSIAFLLPTTNISGGVNVVLKHAQMLRSTGFDVTLLTEQDQAPRFVDFAGARFFALSTRRTIVDAYFDKLVTTLWSTCPWGNAYARAKICYYLVQNFETDFYEPGDFLRQIANSTYSRYPNLRYITISRWCEKWLKERFGQDAVYAPNGIDLALFQYAARDFSNEKIRVLIEGDSESPYKNIDEAFRIANRLNREKYEVWYLSYQGRPKPWYRFDKFLHKVSYDQVADVYHACHIILKTSILESFSYPPLEMMATGGLVVVRPNGGNLEYLRDQENCLMYRENDIDHAQECIERLVSDSKLREMLIENGRATAHARSWDAIKDQVLQLYM